jgi:hypothetical protein
MLGAVGCAANAEPAPPTAVKPPTAKAAPAATKAPSSAPSRSGPRWEAYEAGRTFGREHQGEPGTGDASNPDIDSAVTWCTGKLPEGLKRTHAANTKPLTFGCVGGLLPSMDNPDFFAK